MSLLYTEHWRGLQGPPAGRRCRPQKGRGQGCQGKKWSRQAESQLRGRGATGGGLQGGEGAGEGEVEGMPEGLADLEAEGERVEEGVPSGDRDAEGEEVSQCVLFTVTDGHSE